MNTMPCDIIKNSGISKTKSIKELKEMIKNKKIGTPKILCFITRKKNTTENEKLFDISEL